MSKNRYQQPLIKTHRLHSASILAGSTGAHGEDVRWGAKGTNFSLSSEEDEDNTFYHYVDN